MNLPPGVFRYLLIGQAIIPFFINIAVNVILGGLTFGGRRLLRHGRSTKARRPIRSERASFCHLSLA